MTATWTLRNLARHPVRTGLVVLGIAVAAALLLDMMMLRGGMERSFSAMLLSRGFQIRLSPKGTLPFDTEAVIPGVTPLVDALRRDPDVAEAGAVVGSSVYGVLEAGQVPLVGYGIDPRGQGLHQLLRGSDLAPGDTLGVLLGRSAAAASGWEVGDTITLRSRLDPQALQAAVERRLVVRGLVDWLYDSRDQRSVGTEVTVMQRLAGLRSADGASAVMVKVREGASVEQVAARIAAAHRTIEVNSVEALVERFRARLVYFRQLALILATISLVVAVLLVGTILTIAVNERLGEIAVLRAIGVSRARIVRLVITEGAALTALGALLGTVLGLATARYLDAILTSFPGLPAAISFFVAEPGALVRATAALLAAGSLAGAWPAWVAARTPIALILRSDAE